MVPSRKTFLPTIFCPLLIIFALNIPDAFCRSVKQTETSTPAQQARVDIPAGWTVFRGQSGLIVFHPVGWQVQERNGGAFFAYRPGQGGGVRSVVFVQPIEKIEGTAAGVAQGIGQISPDLFPGVKVTKSRAVSSKPEVAVAEISYSAGGQTFRGLSMCFKDQSRKGVLYTMSSTPETWNQEEPVMKQILSRFFYSGHGVQSGNSKSASMVMWRDPLEGAFVCPVPQGWKVEGGMKRFSAVDVRSEIIATSPDNKILVRVGDSFIPPMNLPAPYKMNMGFYEGQWETTGGIHKRLIMHYLPSALFLTQFYLPQRVGQVQNVQSRDFPEMSQQLASQLQGGGMAARVDTAEITFDTQTTSGYRRGYAFAQTVLVPSQTIPGDGFWYVATFNGYLADPKAEPTAQMVLKQMVSGYKQDPNWAARQRQTMAQIAGIARQSQQDTMDIINRSYQERTKSQDLQFENWSRSYRGQVLIQDPATGQKYEVPSGSRYYYGTGSGNEIIGSDATLSQSQPGYWLREMRIIQ
jgi:hypothetical protein